MCGVRRRRGQIVEGRGGRGGEKKGGGERRGRRECGGERREWEEGGGGEKKGVEGREGGGGSVEGRGAVCESIRQIAKEKVLFQVIPIILHHLSPQLSSNLLALTCMYTHSETFIKDQSSFICLWWLT